MATSWLYLTSVSVNNGDITVSVSGGHDLSSVEAGWSFDVGTYRAEISSGTAADASGNSTLTLAVAWDGANVTNQAAKVVPTSGALIKALNALNETNDYAIATHEVLDEFATEDKEITLTDKTGETHTFSSLPKIIRLVSEAQDAMTNSSTELQESLSSNIATQLEEFSQGAALLQQSFSEDSAVQLSRFISEASTLKLDFTTAADALKQGFSEDATTQLSGFTTEADALKQGFSAAAEEQLDGFVEEANTLKQSLSSDVEAQITALQEASQSLGSDVNAAIDELNAQAPFELSAQPTLTIDHVNQKYSVYENAESGVVEHDYADILTVNRATTVTVNDRVGGVSTIGVDKIAYAFDPETGENLGAQMAESCENLATESVELLGTNQGVKTVLSGDSIFNGDYVEYVPNSIEAWHYITLATVGVEIGDVVTMGVYVKRSEGSYNYSHRFQITGQSLHGTVNLSTGEIMFNGGFDTFTVTHRKDGWFHVVSTVTLTVAGTLNFWGHANKEGVKFEGDDVSGIYLMNSSLYKSPYELPYIPTAGSSVTSAEDEIYRVFGEEFNRHSFTVYCEFKYSDDFIQPSVSRSPICSIKAGVTAYTNRLSIERTSTNNDIKLLIVSENSTEHSIKIADNAANSTKVAVSLEGGVLIYASLSGGELLSGTVTTELDKDFLRAICLGGDGVWQGVQKGVRYDKRHLIYPRAFSQTALEQLVTKGAENVTYA